jgi:hypothetical protein
MDTFTASSRDILLYGLPLVVLLLISLFRLDELLGAPRSRNRNHGTDLGYRKLRAPMRSDPDGRPWNA